MKRTIKYISFGVLSVFALASCSDEFLQDKKNYDNVNEGIYDYFSGANGRVNDVYSWALPTVNDLNWRYPSMGNADIAAKSTEEYTGFSDFVDSEVNLSSMSNGTSVPDFFLNSHNNIQESVYGRIRNINDVIRGIENGSLSQDEKDVLLGQVYFFRAWCYYNLVKWYGGVPILTQVLDPVEDNFTPRSSAKDCIDFIIEDLERSAELLSAKTTNGGWSGSDWGRVTSGTALALKGRVLLLWASPLFNRANDQSRWTNAYSQMKADLATINACGYGLYQTGSNVNGSDFAAQFLQSGKNPEAVFVTLYNNIANEDNQDNQKNNGWERAVRPSNTGGGGKGAGYMLVQMFPMADGRIPAGTGTYTKLKTSDYSYETSYPFMNRDPRFYRTFAFPGFRWAYSGDPTQRDSHNPSYNDGKDYVLWNYVWYTDLNDQGNVENGDSYAADNLLGNKTGIYVRKKSDDLDVNGSPLYNYDPIATKNNGPFFSAAPLIELRYAEVLLNLAEAACGAGEVNEALGYVNQVRRRAGVPDLTTADFIGEQQPACMSAILYERQIELAYEGKRFDDMRRWMLFDGGTQLPDGAPTSWTLTGWGGNTCTWLGFTQFNGQRRESIEFRVADQYGVGGTQWNSDPMQGVARPDGVDFRNADLTTQLETLKQWYTDNLVISEKRGDGYDSQHNLKYIAFRPKYYFLGLASGAADKNKGLPQTIGWEDYNNGGANGTFDPLAEGE
ncbi:MAG: RagB/SusD family nutrient uptake outer membrane protein [Prevotella sp.]|nr:RagB/SusD family nutrient uptake outer membrane protein [Prevotella sp.]